ncbi:hypothetical protein GCM10028895_38770 [Pontibacter rugosus]
MAQTPLEGLPTLHNAKVIAVGESAHGVKDFTKYKVELFKALVTKGVTRTLLIETNYSAASAINDYIRSNQGSQADSVMKKGLYGIWAGDDMAELITWMRDYNSSKPTDEQLSFLGFDAQSAKAATEAIENFLKEKNADSHTLLPVNGLTLMKELGVSRTYNIKKLPKEDQEKIKKSVIALRSLVDVHAAQRPALHLHMRVIEHTLAFEKANPINFTNIRDANMAEIVAEQLKHESKPVFLWAHNGHINKARSLWYKPMGYHLSNVLGAAYVAVGLDFRAGEIRNTYTTGTTRFEPVQDPKWIGKKINQPMQEVTLLHMKDFKGITIRNIGSGNGMYKTKSDQSFDYMVYFKNVSPM